MTKKITKKKSSGGKKGRGKKPFVPRAGLSVKHSSYCGGGKKH